jgi:choline dehydrogenase
VTKPKSRGTVRLTAADPLAPIAVDPNYLGDPADLVVDAVMPMIPCCNTNAPTLSLAERAADIVLATA